MVRAINVFVLGCLLFCVGTVTLFLVSWAVAAAGGGDLVTPLVAVGLAILMPCSFLAAGMVFPGPPRPQFELVACPSCGSTTAFVIRNAPGVPQGPHG
ncbi:MAG: hypothetical protein RLZZ326_1952 [Planctomycetota bacterium]|jgi:hypothetical protein